MAGEPGVLHGNRTYLLQDEDGQIIEGLLDFGRSRLSWYRAGACVAPRYRPGRSMCTITDEEALEAFQLSCRLEGIIPALEPSHALAHVMPRSRRICPKDHLMVHEYVRPRRQGYLHCGQASGLRDGRGRLRPLRPGLAREGMRVA